MENFNNEKNLSSSAMAQTQLRNLLYNAQEISNVVDNLDEIEPWIQDKLSLAKDYIETINNHLKFSSSEETGDNINILADPQKNDIIGDTIGANVPDVDMPDTDMLDTGMEDNMPQFQGGDEEETNTLDFPASTQDTKDSKDIESNVGIQDVEAIEFGDSEEEDFSDIHFDSEKDDEESLEDDDEDEDDDEEDEEDIEESMYSTTSFHKDVESDSKDDEDDDEDDEDDEDIEESLMEPLSTFINEKFGMRNPVRRSDPLDDVYHYAARLKKNFKRIKFDGLPSSLGRHDGNPFIGIDADYAQWNFIVDPDTEKVILHSMTKEHDHEEVPINKRLGTLGTKEFLRNLRREIV